MNWQFCLKHARTHARTHGETIKHKCYGSRAVISLIPRYIHVLIAHHKWYVAWNDSHFLRRSCMKQKPMFTLHHLLHPPLLPKTVTEKLYRSLEQYFILSLEHSLFIRGILLKAWYNLSLCSSAFYCVIFVYVLSSCLFFWLVITFYFTVFFVVPLLDRRCVEIMNCFQEPSRQSTLDLRQSKMRGGGDRNYLCMGKWA